ncbi:AAA family ATPase [Streptomyces albipurpureus]|uniref:Nuclease SbcCD subunit C n=1 Tax=Streptomyces albipurpureus TaxID=2897419 RepID=A0ABT0UTD6_9ACTN|nr:SMC family ATPase [Streptomyces sp. CWNU-1]MCM2391637.1 SMC family ATPase [Streptomyces sp. CWNU-1]
MRLHRLTITAFGPFSGEQEIDFDALTAGGIFLLHGATGSGKTSVLDAVCFALYGTVPGARQSPGTSLRSDHAAAGVFTEVVLELSVGGRRLEISRRPAQLRPKKNGKGLTPERAQSWLREYDEATGQWQALSRSHQEIGEEITQLVGMNRDQFCQVVLLPQGDFARFLRADAEARGRLLGRLFDTRRFAAVEERLAERRRAAEARVRAGDEQLLAVAHRMEQAAGAAGADWPVPSQQPGDPGLGESVLTWAAIARSAAGERADIAEHQLLAAESRGTTARSLLDGERELHHLQQRYENAQRRHEALSLHRAEHEQAQARWERAAKAERVRPALRLRDDAEHEHQSASRTRESTRGRLPSDMADAGAEQLSALERRLRQDLGGLDAARRAETRCAAIDEERAELDRRSRDDDDILAEALGWLDGWDTLRHGCRERITRAQEAATRSGHLAARLGPARTRLGAAQERDRLTVRREEAAQRLLGARDHSAAAKENWLDLKERRLRGIASELAANLTPGAPCTVCGSAEHPHPAPLDGDRVEPAAEDAAYEAYSRAEAAKAAAEREGAVLDESLARARQQARAVPHTLSGGPESAGGTGAGSVSGASFLDPEGASGDLALEADPASGDAAGCGPSVAELMSLVSRLEREREQAHDLASGLHAAQEALDHAEREHQERLAVRQQVERRTAARTSRRDALDEEQRALSAELERVCDGEGGVAELAVQLERRVEQLAEAAEAARTCDTTAQRLKDADGRLAEAAFQAGFSTPGEAADALLTEAGQRALQQRVDTWSTEAAAVADQLADPQTYAAAQRPAADPEAAEAAQQAAERVLRDAVSRLAAARERCAELSRLSREAATEVARLGPVRAEYDRVARLAGLTAGTSADNERKMRLESYVLAARLEQVAAAASARLQRMSSGRYTLVHSDARSGGRRAGLGLHVVDSWTGSERDTATLSGGETFFASLALALGLADVVTEEAGGVRLDTLFIDEGFGSLDEQTLDEVLDVLDSLREQDRSVGIVSHVADLRRRIPTQLEVVKQRDGSGVRLLTAPLGG